MAELYKALDIAKWFVAWADDEEADLSNLKLQKLLYYAQGWHLGLRSRPLFSDEIQAWSHGPVVPSVYHQFKDCGSSDIRLVNVGHFSWDEVDSETAQFLVTVWNTYGEYGAWRLRNMTHAEPPWRDHFHEDSRFIQIPNDELEKYFKSRASKN